MDSRTYATVRRGLSVTHHQHSISSALSLRRLLSSPIATVASRAYYETKSVLSKTQGQPHVLEHNLTSTAMHMARQQMWMWNAAFDPIAGLSGLNTRQCLSSPRHASTYRHDKAHHERDIRWQKQAKLFSTPPIIEKLPATARNRTAEIPSVLHQQTHEHTTILIGCQLHPIHNQSDIVASTFC
jgi:hypothetical protein